MAKQRRGRSRGEKKARPGRKEPLWLRLLKEVPIIALAILLTFIFSNVGLLRKLETAALDTTMRLRHSRTNSDVAIVRITDAEYEDKKLFGGKSPLDPAKLQQIIGAIALGRPKLIAVDLDTSAPAFKEMVLPPAPPLGPRIVWAQNAAYSNIRKQFHLFNVLGGKDPMPVTGVVLFKQDEDGAIRRYTRLCRTEGGLVSSFPWEVVKQLQDERTKGLKESEEDLIADYAVSYRTDLTATDVLDQAEKEGYQTQGILKDKIVLLGGDYAVQDEHDTPIGWMLGVEALAQMIDTELQGGGARPAGNLLLFLLEILDGFLLLLLFRILSLRKALVVCLFALPLLALLCSFVAFCSLARWAYFVPILVLVFFHQAYERGKDYFKKLPERVAEDLG